MRRALAAALAAGFLAVPAHAQMPDTACALPIETTDQPRPTNEQAQYRTRLHSLATGAGVRVAVIDTGVSRHPELPRLRPGDDFVSPDNKDPFFDCDIHGTAVAGIIGSQSTGIAPGATLISVRQSSGHYRTEDDEGTGTLATLAAAIEDALNNRAQVINVSVVACLPPDAALTLNTSPLTQALERAERERAVVVAASGNKGAGCNPGDVVFPAHSPTVLAVGALAGTHEMAEYSVPIPPESTIRPLAAPGGVPLVLSPDGSGWIRSYERGGQLLSFQGTSFATPVVSGTVALLKERMPDATAAEIRSVVVAAADPALGAVDPLTVVEHVPAEYEVEPRDLALEPVTEERLMAKLLALGALGGMLALLLLGSIVAALRPRRSAPPG